MKTKTKYFAGVRKTPVTLRINTELLERTKALAKQKRRTTTSIIEEAVEKILESWE